jgi:hypothetical protein
VPGTVGKIEQTMEVSVRPGVPFHVRAHAAAHNQYDLSGTLRQISSNNLRFEQYTIAVFAPDGKSLLFQSGPGTEGVGLGQGFGCAGPGSYGYWQTLRKE